MAEGGKSQGPKSRPQGLHKPQQTVSCPICNDKIKEASGKKTVGDDAIFCEGNCQSWVHRRCAGLSTILFKELTSTTEPYCCPHCKLQSTVKELNSLKAEFTHLKSALEALSDRQQQKDSSEREQNNLQTHASNQSNSPITSSPSESVLYPTEPRPAIRHPPVQSTHGTDRKFNLVIYGIQENPTRTPRHLRSTNDLTKCLHILNDIHPGMSTNPVRDCTRLGKFTENSPRPRPILLTFVTSIDVVNILSNQKKLSSHRGVSIKPLLSPNERQTESILLKERRNLITSGVPSKQIKLAKSSLYVSGQVHGRVINGSYVRSHTDTQPAPSQPQASTGTSTPRQSPSNPFSLPQSNPSDPD